MAKRMTNAIVPVGAKFVRTHKRDYMTRVRVLEAGMSQLNILNNEDYELWCKLNGQVYAFAHGEELPHANIPRVVKRCMN